MRRLSSFFLAFGCLWTVISIFAITSTLPGFEKAIAEGKPEVLIVPSIIFGIFLIVGILMIALSLKVILANRKLNKEGALEYGRILKVRYAGAVRNKREPEYEAVVLLNINNSPRVFSASIGYDKFAYLKDDYVWVTYLNNKISILEKITAEDSEFVNFMEWSEKELRENEVALQKEKEQFESLPTYNLDSEELDVFHSGIKNYTKSGLRFMLLLWLPFFILTTCLTFHFFKKGETGLIELIILFFFVAFGIYLTTQLLLTRIFINEKYFEFVRGSVINQEDIILKNAHIYFSFDVQLRDGRVYERILQQQEWQNGTDVIIAINNKTKAKFLFDPRRRNRVIPFTPNSANRWMRIANIVK